MMINLPDKWDYIQDMIFFFFWLIFMQETFLSFAGAGFRVQQRPRWAGGEGFGPAVGERPASEPHGGRS